MLCASSHSASLVVDQCQFARLVARVTGLCHACAASSCAGQAQGALSSRSCCLLATLWMDTAITQFCQLVTKGEFLFFMTSLFGEYFLPTHKKAGS